MSARALQQKVLSYWFQGVKQFPPSQAAVQPEPLQARYARWFGGSPETDLWIKETFGSDVDNLIKHKTYYDTLSQDAHGTLALVIMLDQFTRNIYRGTADMFSGDSISISLVEHAIQRQFNLQLDTAERGFLYLPFVHSEDLSIHDKLKPLFTELLQQAKPEDESLAQGVIKSAGEHRSILERFGRYPHRNELLGRVSTPEEIAYLSASGDTFNTSKRSN